MSKLDDQLAHSVYCGVWDAHHNDDGELQSGPCSCNLDAARTELAALRRRAEDAELLLRKIGPLGWWMSYEKRELWSPNDLSPYHIKIDPTGLPILTDEAREALK